MPVDEQYAHVVGQKLPNGWGLCDMSGNVSEWCEDDWHNNYEGAPTDGSAWTGGTIIPMGVVRGGSWFDLPKECRSAYRWRVPNSTCPCCSRGDVTLGFRLVMGTLETRQSRLAREAQLAQLREAFERSRAPG